MANEIEPRKGQPVQVQETLRFLVGMAGLVAVIQLFVSTPSTSS
jgi:hypothetical protein